MMQRAWCCLEEVPYCFSRSSIKFQGHTAKKSSILTQIWRFRSVTVWIHLWLWKGAQSLKERCPIDFRGHLSNFKVTRDKKLQILTRFEPFWTVELVWFHPWLWNDVHSLKQHRSGALLFFKVICQISRSHGTKNCRFWPESSVFGL